MPRPGPKESPRSYRQPACGSGRQSIRRRPGCQTGPRSDNLRGAGRHAWYRVAAVNDAGAGPWSEPVEAVAVKAGAAFAGEDKQTQGDWKGKYGGLGFYIDGDEGPDNPKQPDWLRFDGGKLRKLSGFKPAPAKNWWLPIPLWLLYRYAKSPQLTPQDLADLKDVVLRTKFWMDEPGEDQDCYFTENHQIIFHVDEYLAGQLYPDETFPHDGKSGEWHREHARRHIERWIGWRGRFGFSEWKSMGYSDALLFALLTLREFTAEEELRRKTDMAVDLILLQYALNNFRGDSACSQGRSSWQTIVRGEEWMSGAVCSLAWGVGKQTEVTSAGAICLACGAYQVPAAIQAIALDSPAHREHWERESLNVEEGQALSALPRGPGKVARTGLSPRQRPRATQGQTFKFRMGCGTATSRKQRPRSTRPEASSRGSWACKARLSLRPKPWNSSVGIACCYAPMG